MKILLAGDFSYFWYEEVCGQALEKLGHEIVRFKWGKFFKGKIGTAQNKFLIGPALFWLNQELLSVGCSVKPDVIFVWRGTPVWAETLRKLKQRTGATLVSYNNDDCFGQSRDWRMWKHFKLNIPEYDLHFVYRPVNLEEYQAAGARRVEILLPYFIPELHRPVILSQQDHARFDCDVVFVGHYEDDGRVRYVRALVEAGLHVRLFGGSYWNSKTLGDLHTYFGPVSLAMGEDYVKALTGAKMCLAFLSRLNRDTYTRRSFEIPACGALMLSERTTDLTKFYQEDVEAVFFSTPEELVEKAGWLAKGEVRRKQIAQAGFQRCVNDKHDVVNRMREFCVMVSHVN